MRPDVLIAQMDDEHKRTYSYHGNHKFRQLIKVPKGWGVVFLDDNDSALVISERATFELYENAGLILQMWLLR